MTPSTSPPSLAWPFIRLFSGLVGGCGGVGIFGWRSRACWAPADLPDDRGGSGLDGCLVFLVSLALLSGGLLVVLGYTLWSRR